jgi:hypothetical protein
LACLVLASLGWNDLVAADEAKEQAGLSELSLQVNALQTLYEFEFTPAQMQAVLKLVRQSAAKPAVLPGVQATDKYRQTLTQLRDALIDANDSDRISSLQEKLGDLDDSEDPKLDNDVEITAAARRLAPEALKLLKPRQVTSFLDANQDVYSDPLELLLKGLDQSQTLADDDWKALVRETVDEVGWLLGGLDRKKARTVEQKVEQWLGQVRGLKEAEFKKRRADLEQAARQYVGLVPPTAVLHNIAERALAELLANPQSAAALEARLKDR